MDARLEERLIIWHNHIKLLEKVELEHYQLEGSEKSLEGALYLKAEGKTIDEKKARVYSSNDWKDFQMGLAASRSKYNMERRNLELKVKAYEATYLEYKIENEAMRKGQGGQP